MQGYKETIIEKEDIKEIVRPLSKRIDKKELVKQKIDDKQLYFDDTLEKFSWHSKELKPYWLRELGITMREVYKRDIGKGLVLKDKEVLDDYLYERINTTELASNHAVINNYMKEKIDNANKEMKYIRLVVKRGVESDYLCAISDVTKGLPKIFKEIDMREDGLTLGRALVNSITKGNYNLGKEIVKYNKSDREEMRVSIDTRYIDFWEEFIKLVKDYDTIMRRED